MRNPGAAAQQWDARWFPNEWEFREDGKQPDIAGPTWQKIED
jgi:hypothetical protein